jgi:hypothetical protein
VIPVLAWIKTRIDIAVQDSVINITPGMMNCTNHGNKEGHHRDHHVFFPIPYHKTSVKLRNSSFKLQVAPVNYYGDSQVGLA